MAATDARSETPEAVRAEIAREREQLAEAVHSMRGATDVHAQLRAKLPLLAGAAFAAAFVLGGGIGATMRLLFRRGREGRVKAHVGRFVVVDRS